MPPVQGLRGPSFMQTMNAALDDEDEDAELRELDRLVNELEKESHGFRPGSKWTQEKQNRVLQQYELYVKRAHRLQANVSADELDLVAFPRPADNDDFRSLFEQVRRFILFSAKTMAPRSIKHAHVSYPTLIQLGITLTYWCKARYQSRSGAPLPISKLRAKITEVTRFAASKFNLMHDRTVRKSLLSYSEVTQLIDFDASTTNAVPLAEGHHLAWLIARCCALRPGALGPSRRPALFPNGPPHLIWRDVEIKRGRQDGEYDLKLSIRNLKDSSFDRDVHGRIRGQTNGQTGAMMDFFFKSPKEQCNIAFSPVHRLLVIALRRGALVGITTVEELLADRSAVVRIKPDFLDQPVLLAGAARGLGVSDKPVTAEGLTDYISKRAADAGYKTPITFYSLRRSAAKSLTQAYGADVARQVMCHAPDSRLLESTYLELRQSLDLTAVGLNEDRDQRKKGIEADSDGNALFRLDPETISKAVYPAADALYDRLLATDTVFPTLSSDADQKNRKRALRRIALDTARREVQAEQTAKLTSEDIAQRKKNILTMANSFSERLVSRATASLAAEGHSPLGSLGDESGPDPDVNLAEPKADDEHEPDAEDNFKEVGQQIPEEIDYRVLTKEIPYAEAARHVLCMLLESQGAAADRPALTCDLCQADNTATESDKSKVWPDEKHLERHRKTKFHSGYATWVRRTKHHRDTNQTDGYVCELCQQVIPEDVEIKQYVSIKELERHIQTSDASQLEGNALWSTPDLIEEHYTLKLRMGWDDSEFRGSKELKARNSADQARKRKHQHEDLGVVFLDVKPLEEGISVLELPGIILGGPVIRYPLDPSFVEITATDVEKTQAFPPEQCGPGFNYVEPPTEDTIHASTSAYIRDSLLPDAMLVPTPGTHGNMSFDNVRLLNASLDINKRPRYI